MEREAWQTTVHGVTKSLTRLSDRHTQYKEASSKWPAQLCNGFEFHCDQWSCHWFYFAS